MRPLSTSRPRHDGALTFEAHESTAPNGWDDALRDAGGVVFHSEAWAGHKTHDGGAEPLFCIWRDATSGDVAGRALGIRRPPSSTRAGRIVSKLAFDSSPSGAVDGADYVAPLAGWARTRRALIEVRLGSFDALSDWAPAGVPGPRARIEYVLPPGVEEDVWTGMRSLARRKVKKATASGLECRLSAGATELERFAAIYRTTMERLQASKGLDDHGVDVDRFAGGLAALVERDRGRLYVALRDGEIVGGTAFATFGDRAYLVYSGATDAGRDDGAPFLILFTALGDLRASGFAHINLGGAAPDAADPASVDHGLHQFKTRFGAAAQERTSGELMLHPVRARLVESARKAVRR
jgi:hypothetical protein